MVKDRFGFLIGGPDSRADPDGHDAGKGLLTLDGKRLFRRLLLELYRIS